MVLGKFYYSLNFFMVYNLHTVNTHIFSVELGQFRQMHILV